MEEIGLVTPTPGPELANNPREDNWTNSHVLLWFQDTPLTVSSDSVRDQVAKEIQSLRSQLARSQKALEVLVGSFSYCSPTFQPYSQ